MKFVAAGLLILLVLLQYRLWLGDGGMREVARLRAEISAAAHENAALRERNRTLAAEVQDLKKGTTAIEERARTDLGMVGKSETFYQVVPPEDGACTTARRARVAQAPTEAIRAPGRDALAGGAAISHCNRWSGSCPGGGQLAAHGRRGAPKQYLPLAGRTVIEWALAPFLERDDCERIVVVLARGRSSLARASRSRADPQILTRNRRRRARRLRARRSARRLLRVPREERLGAGARRCAAVPAADDLSRLIDELRGRWRGRAARRAGRRYAEARRRERSRARDRVARRRCGAR